MGVNLLLPGVTTALSVLLLVSCVQVAPDSVGARIVQQRKAESVVLWKERSAEKSGMIDAMHQRTAVLIGGDTSVDFSFHGSSVTVNAKAQQEMSIGSAAAITEDGYYLTAAHCLNDKLTLVRYNRAGLLFAPDARTVWSGKDQGLDLALIHVAADKVFHFELATASEVISGQEVLAGGVGGLKLGESAGRILKVRDRGAGMEVPWKQVIHSSPLLKGDSGGPVINDAGRIVGITSTGGAYAFPFPGERRVHSYRSGALWVDPALIRAKIEEDRKSHRGQSRRALQMVFDGKRKILR